MRSKIILVLAIIMGLVTTVLFYKYMNQFDEAALINESMVDVYAAKQMIKKNQRISAEMITKLQVPQKGMHQQTVLNATDIVGKFATSNISPGESFLSHRLANEKEESLFVSRKVKEGLRAVSVGANFVQSVSNLIEPEDIVDVILSETDKITGEIKSELILEKIRVLAVGRRMIESDPDSVYVEYSSVTLELDSKDTVALVNADERGNIQLVLHSRVIPPGGEEADAK